MLCLNTSCYQTVFKASILPQAEAVNAALAFVVEVKARMCSCRCDFKAGQHMNSIAAFDSTATTARRIKHST